MSRYILLFILLPIISIAQNNCKCCTDNHKAFDFWVGEWNVFLPDGNKAGENSIAKIQDNCILKENWKSANPGYTGTSYNFYNLNTSKWEQLWIDNQGQHLKLMGNRVDNQMVLTSETIKDQNNNDTYNRVTWTLNEDGTVRQLWENITLEDGAEKSIIAFDGLYKRK